MTGIQNTASKIIEWAVYLILFCIPWQTRLIFNESIEHEYWRTSLYGIDMLIALAALLLIYKRSRKGVQNKKILTTLVLFICWSALTAIWAPDKLMAGYKTALLLEGIMLAWILAAAGYSRTKAIYVFVGGAVLQGALGMWQFFTLEVNANKWLGIAAHEAGDLGASVVEVWGAEGIERWIRAYGAFEHPNILGGFLVIALLLLMSETLGESMVATRKRWLVRNVALYGSLALLGAGLFFTFSRSAWLALVVGLVVMTLQVIRAREAHKASFAKGTGALLIALTLLTMLFWPIVQTRLQGGVRLEEKSKIERVSSIGDAWQMIKERPLQGVGAGNYTQALAEKYPDQEIFSYQPVHNVWLLIWAELGIVGLVLVISLFPYSLIPLFLKTRMNKEPWPIILTGIFSSLITISLFDHYLFSLHSGILLIGVVFGFILTMSQDRNTD